MGNTRGLTDKPIVRETIEEDGKVVASHLSDVVTDPNSADAVQVPDSSEYPTANATGNDVLRVNATSPADALDADDTPVNEVQRIDPTGTVSGGTYDFTLPAEATGASIEGVDFDATPAEVQALVDAVAGALDGEGNRNIVVSGAAVSAGNLDFTFQNDFGAQDLSLLSVEDADITGGGTLAAVEVTKGVHSDA